MRNNDKLGRDVFFIIIFLVLALIVVYFLAYKDFDLGQMQGAISTAKSKYIKISFAGSSGTGSIQRSPLGSNCTFTKTTNKCYYPAGTTVTLTAVPDNDSSFNNWTGACNGTNPICTLKVSKSVSVKAVFNVNSIKGMSKITVSARGPGRIESNSTWIGIDCPGKCEGFANSQMGQVILTANPKSGSVFVKWVGDCKTIRSNTCNLGLVSQDKYAAATFCSNECNKNGERRCSSTNTYQICQTDPSMNRKCLVWSKQKTCGSGTGQTNCGYGRCTSKQKPQWYCSDNNCTYTCSTSSNCK
ncbi:MAG: hypothetical protein WC309_03905 [Candidatus Paceibacterota bacterium]|jgi:hypothetical protein|nr:hypothetical protein [Candidatus Paceibacterota bacterium]